jgi:phosphoribosylanthranilate isomerase
MGRTFVKICGVTRVEDALVAARCGADFVGMILHADSPRTIRLDRAREIVAALRPNATPVGVFVDAPLGEVRRACESLRLTHVQLHGDEPPEYAAGLSGLSVWKVLRAGAPLRPRIARWNADDTDAILFDAAQGGSGEANDWHAVAEARDALGRMRLIAAGGLTPDNVAPVVRLLRPFAVDVSSGVEGDTKGIKSEAKIESFIRAVRAADGSP